MGCQISSTHQPRKQYQPLQNIQSPSKLQINKDNIQISNLQNNETNQKNGENQMDPSKQNQTSNNLSLKGQKKFSKQQINQRLKTISFRKVIQTYRQKYVTLNWTVIDKKVDQNRSRIKALQIVIKHLVSQIIIQKLKEVNQNKITLKQCKIDITQSILEILLEAIKYVIERSQVDGINYVEQFIEKIQRFSQKLSSFLKTQYPRGENIEAGQLAKQFEEFDCTDLFEYDMIANANVVFKSLNFEQDNREKKSEQQFQVLKEFQIINNIKIFLNKLMDEIDRNFSDFEKLIEQIEFNINNDTKKDLNTNINTNTNANFDSDKNTKINSNSYFKSESKFKIGRKISENTGRFTVLDTGTIEVNSPQIARVLIKWMEDLQKMISHPQKVFSEDNYDLKTINLINYEGYSSNQEMNKKKEVKSNENSKKSSRYKKLGKKQQAKIKQGIIKALKQNQKLYLTWKKQDKNKNFDFKNDSQISKQQIQKQLPQRIQQNNQNKEQSDYFKEFSYHLLKDMQQANLDHTEISVQQAQLIKYAYSVNKLVSWIVEQRILKAIKTLIDLGLKNKMPSGQIPSLIKFKVNDLMRCQLKGNRKIIKKAYNQFLKLQKTNKIEIVKIKNRFNTTLTDAMIFFKVPDCFLICECQLILTQGYKKQDETKLSNIESINHFLYQLERSPFKILGELSVFLTKNSETITSYNDKIKLDLKKTRKKQIFQSIQNKQEFAKYQSTQIQDLRKPFFCSFCFKNCAKFSNSMIFLNRQLNCRLCQNCIETISQSFIKTDQNVKEKLKQKNQKIIQNINKILQIRKEQLRYDQYFLTFQQVFDKCQPIKRWLQNQQKQKVKSEDIIKDLQKFQPSIIDHVKKIKKTSQKKNELKALDFMKYFDKIQANCIKQSWKVYFVIYQKIGPKQKLNLYKYNAYKQIIQNVWNPVEKYLKHQKIQFHDSSCIITFKNIFRRTVQKQQLQKLIKYYRTISQQKDSKFQYILKWIQQIFDQQQKYKTNFIIKKLKQQSSQKEVLQLLQKKQNQQIQKKRQEIQNIQQKIKKYKQNQLIAFYNTLFKVNSKISNNSQNKYVFYYWSNYNLKYSSKIKSLLLDFQNQKVNDQNNLEKKLKQLPPILNRKKKIDLSNSNIQQSNINSIFTNLIPKQHINNTNIQDKNISNKNQSLSATNIISQFKWIENIKIFILSKNKINDISAILKVCINLKFLNVSENKLTQIKFEQKMNELQELQADNNQIVLLDGFKNVQKLQILILSHNKLKQLKFDTILPFLKQLKISNNQLLEIDIIEDVTPNLEVLDLSSNSLKKIQLNSKISNKQSTKYKTLKLKLSLLNLSFNAIQSPQKIDLNRAQSLKQLYLDGINLNSSNLKQFFNKNKLKEIQIISVRANRLQNLSDIKQQLEKRQKIKQFNLDYNHFNFSDQSEINKILGQKKIKLFSQKSNADKKQMYKGITKQIKQTQKVKRDRQQKNEQQKPVTVTTKACKQGQKNEFDNKNKNELTQDQKQKLIKNLKYTHRNQLFVQYNRCEWYNDQNEPDLFQLNHRRRTINFDQFFCFDWNMLSIIDLKDCGINDKGWKDFVRNADLLPNLKVINISGNYITTVTQQDLKMFKNVYFFSFRNQQQHFQINHNSIYLTNYVNEIEDQQQKYLHNLTKQSLDEIKKFNDEKLQVMVQFKKMEKPAPIRRVAIGIEDDQIDYMEYYRNTWRKQNQLIKD